MLASSFFDLVLGLDIHFEMVPTPPPVPLPIPNPFIGLVFDPLGLSAGIAIGAAVAAVVGAPFQGPVLYWTAFPATNTGTEARHVTGHILLPPGTAWAPFPKLPKPVIHPGETPAPALPVKPENDAVVITGSKTVSVMGSNAVRLGDIALSCSEPLRLPSSVVLAIPKGAPILIGGPPSLDVTAAAMASLRTRFVSDSLHALLSRLRPSRFRNFLHRAVCFFTGHPVDVASGKVMTEFVDIELPGPIPLKVDRIYSSAFATRSGPLGYGWSLSLDQAIWRERGKVVLLAEDGREIEFDTFDFPQHRIEAGQKVYDPIERLTLHCEKNETWRVIDHEGVVREFAPVPGRSDGRAMIQKIRSRCGFHEMSFHYGSQGTANGWLEGVRDSGGRFVRLRWDAHGRVTELHLPQPQGEGFYRHRRYDYDAAGDLVHVTDALAHAWRFAYVTHLLTQETDRSGRSFYFQYDGLGEDAWCVRTWGDGGIYDHVLSYDKRKHVTFVTSSLGHTTQYHMNLVGQVMKVVDPLGGQTQYEYDPVTLALVEQLDALGGLTRFEHDARGNPTAIIYPDGTGISLEYHASRNLPVRIRDQEGGVSTWQYDAPGRVTAWTDPTGAVTTYGYEAGMISGVTSPTGVHAQLSYGAAKTLQRVVMGPSGAALEWEHDALGRVVEKRSSSRIMARLRYDREGNPIEIHDRNSGMHGFEYDAEDNLVRALDRQHDIRLAYTGFHWPHEEREGSSVARLHYDTEGKIVAVENARGEQHRVAYDERGHVKGEEDFGGAKSRYEHDAMGRLRAVTRPSGRRTTYSYDPMHRLTRVEHGDSSHQDYRYRADGALIGADSASARVELRLDPLGRILTERTTLADGTVSAVDSRYDVEGRRVHVQTSHGHAHRIAYDALDRVVAMDAPASGWGVELTVDADGRELARHYASGASVRWSRDEAGCPLTRQLGAAESHRVDQTVYAWAPSGRLREIYDERLGSASYTHDYYGDLIGASYSSHPPETRVVDLVGNVHRTRDGSDREYGAGGMLHAADGVRYRYDADGNLVEREDEDGTVTTYAWNAAGQLAEVRSSEGLHVSYEYDALDRRIAKRIHGTPPEWAEAPAVVHWLWDGDDPIEERDEDQEPRTWIFTRGFRLLAGIEGGRAWSSAPDTVGSATDWFDDAGAIVHRSRLGIFGDSLTLGDDVVRSPFRWPGQYHDEETGLFYNRFRYYSPEQGRYISRDPLGLVGGLALYAYVADPLLAFDPLGLVERFFRFVPEAEARQSAPNLGGNGQLHRRPHGTSLGRGAKWITLEGEEERLGAGTRPDWVLRFEADDGTLAWLQRNGIDYDHVTGEAAAPDKVLLKSAERGSYGVGIELLGELNRRIRSRMTGSRTRDTRGGNKNGKGRCR